MKRDRAGDPPAVRIEAENEWAWCGDRRLDLTHKAFSVLRHFMENARRLVTKDDLMDAVWKDTVVSEAALTSCIRDLRRALEDSGRTPRYIETVHRRGFRFIGPIAPPDAAVASPPLRSAEPSDVPTLVGRDADLARLQACFDAVLSGRRRVVFVTGEAGIGKTTLAEAFLARLDGRDGLRIGRGQCVEQYGAGEPYLPVLEALGRMGREAGGDALVRTLKQYAPSWLAQLPALLTDEDLEAVQRRARGTTHDHTLRELSEALDALAAEAPLVLVLEDLHWSDSATIDLLTMLARRRDPAGLLVLATYRPADVAASGHPLKAAKQELQLHGHCEEVALDFLGEAAVGDYLAERLPRASFPHRLAQVLHRNTSGNPLFLVNLIDHLIAQGRVREVDGRWELSVPVDEVASNVPHTLWQMVETQIERLAPREQALLAVASVAGAEFSAALASVDGFDVHEAEECCAELARRGLFLRSLGVAEWPDGTVAGRYGFIHALYQNALYARVSIGRRVGLHLRIGARLERGHDPRSAEIAGELAMHFEQGRDFERAARYRREAADAALRRHAYRETAHHATRALELLEVLPESPERNERELAIQMLLGPALIAKGWAAPEVARTYARARELCTRVGVTPQLFPVLGGLFGFYVTRADLRIAGELAEQLLGMAQSTDDAALVLGGHNAVGMVSFYRGGFATALDHLERGMGVYDPHRHSPNRSPAFWGGHDAGVSCAVHAAWSLWALGYAARAAARMEDALAWARSADHPFTLAFACHFAAAFYECRRDVDAVRGLADAALVHSLEHGFELLLSLREVHRGWLLCEDGEREDGAALIRCGVTAYQETGAGTGVPAFLGLLAEAYVKLGRAEDGLAVVADARAKAERDGSRFWDAELRRLEGDLILRSTAPAWREAEACFHEAMETARLQEARTFELRAAMSLGRLWRRQGRTDDARALVSSVCGWFTEGFETADLTDARALLAALDGDSGRRA